MIVKQNKQLYVILFIHFENTQKDFCCFCLINTVDVIGHMLKIFFKSWPRNISRRHEFYLMLQSDN